MDLFQYVVNVRLTLTQSNDDKITSAIVWKLFREEAGARRRTPHPG